MPSPSPLVDAAPGAEPGETIDEAGLADDLRERVFRPSPPGPRRIGAEVEVLPVVAATGRMAPITAREGPCTLPALRACAEAEGWSEARTDCGSPSFLTAGGTLISYEPGGQIELSSAPCASVGELTASLRRTLGQVGAAAAERGVLLLSVGIHPDQPAEDLPLQLPGERYRRMDAHFWRIGPAGARMMRLTAACQVNLDWDDPPGIWRLLNAAAPLLVAIFASSPRRAGAASGAKSHRSLAWRELDSGRTGVLGGDAVESYLRFALAAGAILVGDDLDEALPFGEWVRRGAATREAWRAHLTTLFPEIRPKGYAEVRSIDAVDPAWLEAPLVLLAGLTEPPARAEAAALLGEPDPARLERAARAGLADADLARDALRLWDLALEAAGGAGVADAGSVEVARAFADRFTRRGLSPGDLHEHAETGMDRAGHGSIADR